MAQRKKGRTVAKQAKAAKPKPSKPVESRKRMATTREYFGSLVRPTENDQQDRNTKYLLGDLVKRYSKYVKVASLRNAQAVAILKIKVCREKRSDRRKVFRTKDVSQTDLKWFGRSGYVSKAIATGVEDE